MDTNVGGLYLWSWMAIFVALIAFYYLFMSWWDTREAVKKCSGNRILCLFHTIGGQAYWKWCVDEKGDLTPADMKGYDKVAKGLADKAIGKIKAEKQEFGWYFVLPDHVFSIPYPFVKPKATARIAEYVENYPAPRVTANLSTWDAKQYESVTSAMAEAAKDTGDIKAIISEAAGIEEKLMGLLDIPQQIKSNKMWHYISVGEGAIIIYLCYMIMDKVGKIGGNFGISILQFFGIIGS
jgi:hypothetical protein